MIVHRLCDHPSRGRDRKAIAGDPDLPRRRTGAADPYVCHPAGGAPTLCHNRDVRRFAYLTLAAALTASVAAGAQFRGQERPHRTDVTYDGRFTFVRLAWRSDLGSSRRGFNAAWNHDVPRAENHLSQIIRSLTYVKMHTEGSRILTLDDPELFKYPIAFMWEPGFWNLNDREAEAFSLYLRKGGLRGLRGFRRRPAMGPFRSADATGDS